VKEFDAALGSNMWRMELNEVVLKRKLCERLARMIWMAELDEVFRWEAWVKKLDEALEIKNVDNGTHWIFWWRAWIEGLNEDLWWSKLRNIFDEALGYKKLMEEFDQRDQWRLRRRMHGHEVADGRGVKDLEREIGDSPPRLWRESVTWSARTNKEWWQWRKYLTRGLVK